MATLTAVVQASKDNVFSWLSDYSKYEEWTADVVKANVLEREGDILYAEFLSPALMETEYTLEIVHLEAEWRITYHQVDRHARGLVGEWHLGDASEGTLVKGTMALKTSQWQPWKQLSNRRRVRLVLQRRLDALRQIYSDTPLLRFEFLPIPDLKA